MHFTREKNTLVATLTRTIVKSSMLNKPLVFRTFTHLPPPPPKKKKEKKRKKKKKERTTKSIQNKPSNTCNSLFSYLHGLCVCVCFFRFPFGDPWSTTIKGNLSSPFSLCHHTKKYFSSFILFFITRSKHDPGGSKRLLESQLFFSGSVIIKGLFPKYLFFNSVIFLC